MRCRSSWTSGSGATGRVCWGAVRGYDIKDCVRDKRARRVTPHVVRMKKHSAIDVRTTRHAGYTVSLRIRKRVEEVFGWMKTVGGLRRTR